MLNRKTSNQSTKKTEGRGSFFVCSRTSGPPPHFHRASNGDFKLNVNSYRSCFNQSIIWVKLSVMSPNELLVSYSQICKQCF